MLTDKKTKRYDAVVRFGGNKQLKRTFKTLKAARDWRDKQSVDVNEGTFNARKPTTFDDFAREWKEDNLILKKLKASTVRGYRTIIDRYLVPFFEGCPLTSIDHYAVGKLETGLLKSVSTKTTHNALTLLGRMMENARKSGFIRTSPMQDYEKVEYECEPGRVLTPDEIGKLLDECDEKLRLVVLLGLMAGLRRSEILSMFWTEDRGNIRSFVDFDAGKVCVKRVFQWLSRKHGQVEDDEDPFQLVRPKSFAGIRDVPMSSDLKYELEQYSWREGDDLIFHSATGHPLNPSNVYGRWFAPAVDRAGIGPVGMHDLRHTAGSVWLDTGASLYDVQRWLGHQDISTTIRVYGHPVTDRGPEVTARADAYYAIFGKR